MGGVNPRITRQNPHFRYLQFRTIVYNKNLICFKHTSIASKNDVNFDSFDPSHTELYAPDCNLQISLKLEVPTLQKTCTIF